MHSGLKFGNNGIQGKCFFKVNFYICLGIHIQHVTCNLNHNPLIGKHFIHPTNMTKEHITGNITTYFLGSQKYFSKG